MTKVLLVLNGPMCAGKSTVSEEIMKQDGWFKASNDRVKWLISNFTPDEEVLRKKAKEITFAMMSEAIHQDLSILIDGGFHEFRDRYKALADKHGYKYVSVNIETSYDVLKQRFLERVEATRKIDRPTIAITTIDGFDSRYNWYTNENKDDEAVVTLDSGNLKLADLVSEIDKLID